MKRVQLLKKPFKFIDVVQRGKELCFKTSNKQYILLALASGNALFTMYCCYFSHIYTGSYLSIIPFARLSAYPFSELANLIFVGHTSQEPCESVALVLTDCAQFKNFPVWNVYDEPVTVFNAPVTIRWNVKHGKYYCLCSQ
jgi:hypothetical protein